MDQGAAVMLSSQHLMRGLIVASYAAAPLSGRQDSVDRYYRKPLSAPVTGRNQQQPTDMTVHALNAQG